jgi:hypothetical protein
MTKPIARDPMYRKRAFHADIIELCVRWYITYRMSYRDFVEMMAERGIPVAHTTVLRRVTRHVPEFEKRWSRFAKAVGTAACLRRKLSFRDRRQFGRQVFRGPNLRARAAPSAAG